MPRGPRAAREVVCVDLDCFYAQALERLRPELRGKPLAVRQKYITVTCNYEARAHGVSKLMSLEDSKQRCPELVIVDGSDLRPFREASEEIAAVLTRFGCPVERKGMDESFVDVSALVDTRVGAYEASQLDFVGHLLGEEDTLDRVTRARLAQASVIAQEMRDALLQELQFRSCAGVGTCKTSAKLAAELHKPNQQSIILPDALCTYMSDLPAGRVQGLGRSMLRQIHAALSDPSVVDSPYALTCAQIRDVPLDRLTRALGNASQADFVFKVVRGIDERPIRPSEQAKTISQEETSLPHPDTWESANARLRVLCTRIMDFVRERREKHNQVAHTLRVSITDKIGSETRDSQSFANRAEHEAYRRRGRRHVSKQCKVDECVFANVDALHRCAQGLLRGCLPSPSFLLSRINLAIADFHTLSTNTHQQRGIKQFFAKPSNSGRPEQTPAAPPPQGPASRAPPRKTLPRAAETLGSDVIDLCDEGDSPPPAKAEDAKLPCRAAKPSSRPVKRSKITSYFQ